MEELRSEILSVFRNIDSKQTKRVLEDLKSVSIVPRENASPAKNVILIEKPDQLVQSR